MVALALPRSMVNSKPAVARFATRGVNYFTLVGWLLRDFWRGSGARLAVVAALSALYLATQAAAVLVLYGYTQKLQSDGSIVIPQMGVDLHVRTEPLILWAAVTLATLCFVASALTLFFLRHLTLNVLEGRVAKNLEALVSYSLRLPDPRAPLASELLFSYGDSAIRSGLTASVFVALICSYAIPPILGSLGAAVILFTLDFQLTVLMALAAILGIALVYPITLRSVRNFKKAQQSQTKLRGEIADLKAAQTHFLSVNLSSAAEVASGLMGRRRIMNELALALQIGVTAILALAIVHLALRGMGGNADWALIVAYAGALRLTLSGGSQAVTAVARLSRTYPPIVRYFLFMRDAARLDATSLGKPHAEDIVTLGTLEDGRPIQVKCGDRVAALSDDPGPDLRFAFLRAIIARSQEPLGAALLRSPISLDTLAPDAEVVLIETGELAHEMNSERLVTALKDKVTVLIHRETAKVGQWGEKYVATIEEGVFKSFHEVGTAECEATLEAFAYRRKNTVKKRVVQEEVEEEF